MCFDDPQTAKMVGLACLGFAYSHALAKIALQFRALAKLSVYFDDPQTAKMLGLACVDLLIATCWSK